MKPNSEILIALLALIFAENIPIIQESRGNLAGIKDAMFWRNGKMGPEIRLVRDANDPKVFLGKNAELDSARFIETSTDILGEICKLAHEFGHHYSKSESASIYDRVVAEGRLHPTLVQPDEGLAILKEENFAWDHARETLRRLGFQNWDEFERHRQVGLESYRGFVQES